MTTVAQVRSALADVTDPEIPVVTIEDLGVLRAVAVDGESIVVTITPTYSGCPAMETIQTDITTALARHGWHDVTVRTVLSPAWTTEWVSETGRRALQAYGIAPPSLGPGQPVPVQLGRRPPACPQCGSGNTEELTRFGSTSCKALWRCRDCREPFDHFKDH